MSSFEFVSGFGLDNATNYSLSHPSNFSLVGSSIPQQTSYSRLSVLTYRLDELHNAKFDVHDAALHYASTAISMVPVFLNGAVGS